jgi:hypothetical protein
MSYKFCCDEFEDATLGDPESDADKPVYAYQNRWRFVADCYALKYCPFCGVELRAPPSASNPGAKE